MAFYELPIKCLLKLVSFLFWAHMYLCLGHIEKDKSPEWCARVVTMIHGLSASIIGYDQCDVLHGGLPSKCFTRRVSPLRYALMLWSWGYFAFGLLWCIVYSTESVPMLCYHISALGAVTIYMHQYHAGCTFACTLALMEITTPLMQMRWFLKQEGYEDSRLLHYTEILYLTMFFIVRGILGTFLVYYVTFKADFFTTEHKIITVALYILSMGFLLIKIYCRKKGLWRRSVHFVAEIKRPNILTIHDIDGPDLTRYETRVRQLEPL